MPTTFISLLIFIALLVPGVVYVSARESRLPSQVQSTFKETATVAFASFACWTVALVIFSILRASLPDGKTPDAGALARNPGHYGSRHLALLAWWSLGLLVIAIALAFMFGTVPLLTRMRRRVLGGSQWDNRARSEWDVAFTAEAPTRVYLKVILEDGSMYAGWHGSHNWDPKESADRELTLDPPLKYRPPLSHAVQTLTYDKGVIVSARRIMAIRVFYCKPDDIATSGVRNDTLITSALGSSDSPAPSPE